MESTQPSFNCDETPTPTRFIRNCEEVGLFQDLQNNPFEETFRIAVQTSSHTTHSLPEPLSKSVNADTLDTPQVVPNSKRIEDYQHSYPIIEDEEDEIKLSSNYLIEYIFQDDNDETNTVEKHSDEIQRVQVIDENEYRTNEQLNPESILPHVLTNDCENNVQTEKQDTEPEKTVIDLTLSPVHEQTLDLKTDTSPSRVLEEIFFVNDDQSSAQKSITDEFLVLHNEEEKVESQNLSIQDLKNVQLPNSPTMITSKNVFFIPSSSNSNFSNIGAIKISPKSGKPAEPTVKDRLKTLLKPNRQYVEQKFDIITPNQAPIPVTETHHEKIVYCRERNRIAQKRCRIKKKKWISQLERDTESVHVENKHLRSERVSLLAEIAHLKTLLLAHKNCPVTQAQADKSDVVQKHTQGGSRQLTRTITLPATSSISNGNRNGVATPGQKVCVISSNLRQNKKLVMDSKRVPISQLNGTREKYRNNTPSDKKPPLKVFISTDAKTKTTVNSPNAVNVIHFNQNVSEITDLTYDSS